MGQRNTANSSYETKPATTKSVFTCTIMSKAMTALSEMNFPTRMSFWIIKTWQLGSC